MKKLAYFALCSCTALLVACQTPKAPTLATTAHSEQAVPLQFKISGKIGVRTPKESSSAFYGWSQYGDQFAIELSGALGIGQTTIDSDGKQVTLQSSKTGTISADTPEELLFQATGWQAPITHLSHWINGKPATPQAITQRDDLGRFSHISEDGWQASLHYDGQATLPDKLIISDAQSQYRITLTIQSRE